MACTLPTRSTKAIRSVSTTTKATPVLPSYRRSHATNPRDVRMAFRPSDGRQDLIVSSGASKNKSKYVLPKNAKGSSKGGKGGKGESPNRDFLTKSVTGEYDTAIFFLLVPALALLFLPILSLALGGLHDKYPSIFGPFL